MARVRVKSLDFPIPFIGEESSQSITSQGSHSCERCEIIPISESVQSLAEKYKISGGIS